MTSDWNAISDAYVGLPFSTEWQVGYPKVIDALGLLPGSKVLDYGCGDGKFSKILTELGAQVLGVDISPRMIELAKTNETEHLQFRLINSDKLGDIPSGYFDAATLCWVLCAIQDETGLRVVADRLARLLKPGGRLVIIENNPKAFGRRFSSFSVDRHEGFSLDSPSVVEVKLYGPDRREVHVQDAYWPDDTIRSVFSKTLGFRAVGSETSPPENPPPQGRWTDDESSRPFRVLVFNRG